MTPYDRCKLFLDARIALNRLETSARSGGRQPAVPPLEVTAPYQPEEDAETVHRLLSRLYREHVSTRDLTSK